MHHSPTQNSLPLVYPVPPKAQSASSSVEQTSFLLKTWGKMSSPLSHDEFFASLHTLLTTQSTSSRGSIFLTQKRLPTTPSSTSQQTPSPSAADAGDYSILIRLSNGRHKLAKSKASTVVGSAELEAFYARYAEVCKAGMVGMKKREKKRKKGKGKKGAAA
ncbi:hypothetical protein AJ80_08576 [Polytolypa hystricis UAMH7299]|uniref:Signal recognition particle subunit SRP14 n=1 Tax=Polytolypa hystricis (strain UAMH7299) TaxID=1447883 RepID=A0A2B7WXL3_POLH7|nr:hypothetical protein AJ80_08576 [Polytolypa hystricis UAMH7299]